MLLNIELRGQQKCHFCWLVNHSHRPNPFFSFTNFSRGVATSIKEKRMEKIFEDVQDLFEHTKFHCLVKCKCENCGIVFNTTKETVKRNQKIICSLCKRKNTNLKKYGVEFYGIFGSEEHNKSIKEKYGVENVSSLNWVIQKRKETCEKIYGGVAPACSKEIYEKMKKTCKKRFGVEFSSQSSEIKEKVKETNLKNMELNLFLKMKL